MTDLVPDDLLSPDHNSGYEPRRLLDELAEELTQKTAQKIEGEVLTRYPSGGQAVEHEFSLRAIVTGYRYLLFSVRHGIDEYPLTLVGPGQGEVHHCNERREFEDTVREIFGSPRTKRLVNELARTAS